MRPLELNFVCMSLHFWNYFPFSYINHLPETPSDCWPHYFFYTLYEFRSKLIYLCKLVSQAEEKLCWISKSANSFLVIHCFASASSYICCTKPIKYCYFCHFKSWQKRIKTLLLLKWFTRCISVHWSSFSLIHQSWLEPQVVLSHHLAHCPIALISVTSRDLGQGVISKQPMCEDARDQPSWKSYWLTCPFIHYQLLVGLITAIFKVDLDVKRNTNNFIDLLQMFLFLCYFPINFNSASS